MLELFNFLNNIQTAIGNNCEVAFRKDKFSLILRIGWWDTNFHFQYIIPDEKIAQITDVSVIENYIIQLAIHRYENKIES